MKNFIGILALTLYPVVCLQKTALAAGHDKPKAEIVKVKKTEEPTSKVQKIRKIGSDESYDYYEITEAELRWIEEARKIFSQAKKLPPPPDSLQKKMQDQVGE